MLGWTQILRRSLWQEDLRVQALDAIERGVGAQTRLIEDLLDASRMISVKCNCRSTNSGVSFSTAFGDSTPQINEDHSIEVHLIRVPFDMGAAPTAFAGMNLTSVDSLFVRGSQLAEGLRLPDHGHRPVQYLNNVLEQDHRAIKRRGRASQHFRSSGELGARFAGYEAIHMIRKGRACWSVVGAKVGLLHRFIFDLCAAMS